jgi:hypothetical protein
MINDNHGKAPMGRHVTARGNAPGISGKNTPSPVGAAHFWFFDRNSETEPDDRADSGATTKGTNNTYRGGFFNNREWTPMDTNAATHSFSSIGGEGGRRPDEGATTKGTNNTYRGRFLTTANGRQWTRMQ